MGVDLCQEACHSGPGDGVAVYVHIPFCVRKCYYCDFNSYPLDDDDGDGDAARAYVDALVREAALNGEQLAQRGLEVRTLYIGGGTPTSLHARLLARVLAGLGRNLPVRRDAEITVEANPGTLDGAKLEAMLDAGVNRLSLGAQAMDDDLLARIGRIHRVGDFLESFAAARRAGFQNINVDLIFALPGQDLARWRETLEAVVALAPEHISTYNLVIEEGTRFGRELEAGILQPVDEELDADMYQLAIDYLAERGYEHYEISNFALPGHSCLHNITYWRNEAYLGLGAGAHSHFDGKRYSNVLLPGDYVTRIEGGLSPVAEVEQVTVETEKRDTVILGLRMLRGVLDSEFYARFGIHLREAFGPEILELSNQGLLRVNEDGDNINNIDIIALTRRGLFLANEVFMRFLP
ncbi:MAG TPA: radical SAM family heme chaperone HemW [Firmicutes bacterium]|nr:radical SAM family heme chaperone HemW [Bacillota bacterium]